MKGLILFLNILFVLGMPAETLGKWWSRSDADIRYIKRSGDKPCYEIIIYIYSPCSLQKNQIYLKDRESRVFIPKSERLAPPVAFFWSSKKSTYSMVVADMVDKIQFWSCDKCGIYGHQLSSLQHKVMSDCRFTIQVQYFSISLNKISSRLRLALPPTWNREGF